MMLQTVVLHAGQNPGITSLFLGREMKTTAFLGAGRMVFLIHLAHWPPDCRMRIYCLDCTRTPERTFTERWRMANGPCHEGCPCKQEVILEQSPGLKVHSQIQWQHLITSPGIHMKIKSSSQASNVTARICY